MVPRDSSYQGLLLLPSLPSDISANSLRVAYGPALTRVLQELAEISANTEANVILTIAVAYNGLSSPGYTKLQKFFALMYRLTCIISTERSIDIRFGNDVDTRITLFEYTEKGQSQSDAPRTDVRFISLEDLAKSQRPWSQVFSIESETGEGLLQEFLRSQKSPTPGFRTVKGISRVPGGLIMKVEDDKAPYKSHKPSDDWNSHYFVAVGGTFDHLHAGHKLLLTMTALLLEPVHKLDASKERCLIIGITGDDLLKNKKYRDELETWEERQDSVQCFLLDFLSFLSFDNVLKGSETVENPQVQGREVHNELQSGLKIKYKEIFDPFGPTVTDPKITALVISAETRTGGRAINDKRAEKKWRKLEVFEVDVLNAAEDNGEESRDDFESKISSTEIRSKIHQKRGTGDANAKID